MFLLLLFLAHRNECVEGLRLSLANGYVVKESEQINIVYGDPLDIFCTGEDNKILITKDDDDELYMLTTTINRTTIRYFEEKPLPAQSVYYCDDRDRMETEFVKIVVDIPPEAANFRCVLKNFDYLNCTWTSANIFRNFSLYHVNSGSSSLVCNLDHYEPMICIWDKKNPSIPYQADAPLLTFLMKTCNHMKCVTQTFIIHQDKVLKLDPPEIISLPGPRYTNLLWMIPNKYYEHNLKIDHRIKYWYSGIDLEANVSFRLDAKNCHKLSRLERERTCEYKLKLPCPDTFYEIMMSTKSLAAVGEEYWSDDAVLSFVTTPEPENENVNTKVHQTCNHQRVKITREVMLFELDKMKNKMNYEYTELKEKIKLLKLKRDRYF